MSYQLKIDPKARKAARFVSSLQKALQEAFVSSGKTQQEVASILGVDRSVVNRRLKGSANLTARSIAEFAFALEKDIQIQFLDQARETHKNWTVTTDTRSSPHNSAPMRPGGTISPNKQYKAERTAS